MPYLDAGTPLTLYLIHWSNRTRWLTPVNLGEQIAEKTVKSNGIVDEGLRKIEIYGTETTAAS
jgi:hypothetical protein